MSTARTYRDATTVQPGDTVWVRWSTFTGVVWAQATFERFTNGVYGPKALLRGPTPPSEQVGLIAVGRDTLRYIAPPTNLKD